MFFYFRVLGVAFKWYVHPEKHRDPIGTDIFSIGLKATPTHIALGLAPSVLCQGLFCLFFLLLHLSSFSLYVKFLCGSFFVDR